MVLSWSIQSESHSPGSSTNHGVNQDETHVYDSLQHGEHHKTDETVVYSEVKIRAAEDSLMYAEVKRPKKEKAKKKAGKSSPAADAAVYSEITLGSFPGQ
ncbi:unnamed protein product [Oreochromis niloticus]|nr:unnamed protein product [Mustela putorius furo]